MTMQATKSQRIDGIGVAETDSAANDNHVAEWFGDNELAINFIALFWTLPYLKQQKFVYKSGRRYQLFLAGRGAGKTYALIVKAIFLALMNPECPGAVFGRTLKNDIKLKLYPMFQQIVAHIFHVTGIQIVESFDSAAWVTTLINGAQIYWLPYGKLDQLEKNRGLDLAWAVLDEIEHAQVDPAYAFDVIDDAVRNPRARILQIAIGTTPKGLRGCVARFLKETTAKNPDFFVITATSYDNPHLNHSEIKKRERARSKRMVDQEIYAVVLRPANVVFREFSKKTHLCRWKPRGFLARGSIWGVGVDWGTTKGHVVFVEMQSDGTWIVFDEIRFDSVSRPDFRDQLHKRCLMWMKELGCGPFIMGTDRAILDENDLLRQRWWKQKPRGGIHSCGSTTEQEVLRGVGYIQYMLQPGDGSRPKLFFADRLTPALDTETRGLLGAMANYRYLERTIDGTRVTTNEPLKDEINDDQIDALRYLVVVSRKTKQCHGGKVLGCLNVREDGYSLAA